MAERRKTTVYKRKFEEFRRGSSWLLSKRAADGRTGREGYGEKMDQVSSFWLGVTDVTFIHSPSRMMMLLKMNGKGSQEGVSLDLEEAQRETEEK